MARPQGTPFGMIAKERVDVGSQQLTYNSTVLKLSGGIQLSGKSTSKMTGDSTGVVLAGGIKISNQLVITSDSTTILLAGNPAALPGDYSTGTFAVGTNSTGNNFVAVRTTGTTWKYLNVTTALPT